ASSGSKTCSHREQRNVGCVPRWERGGVRYSVAHCGQRTVIVRLARRGRRDRSASTPPHPSDATISGRGWGVSTACDGQTSLRLAEDAVEQEDADHERDQVV